MIRYTEPLYWRNSPKVAAALGVHTALPDEINYSAIAKGARVTRRTVAKWYGRIDRTINTQRKRRQYPSQPIIMEGTVSIDRIKEQNFFQSITLTAQRFPDIFDIFTNCKPLITENCIIVFIALQKICCSQCAIIAASHGKAGDPSIDDDFK